MPETIEVISTLPDLDFTDGQTPEEILDEMVADYEAYMAEVEGETVTLDRADPHRAILSAATPQIYQAMMYADRAGKRNTLKYSYAEFLDNLAALKGITRTAAAAAKTTVRFTLSAVRESATGIPSGTRVSSQSGVYFATEEYAEIPAGELTVDVGAACVTTGTAGNDIATGELNVIVDPIAYVQGAVNTTAPEGGADEETDDALRERVFLAPSKYAVGTADGYYYRVKEYSAAIGDVVITSNQKAGKVDIVFLKTDGSSPGEELISGLQEYMEQGDGHILNDLVTCAAPEEVEYSINFTYYIRQSDSARAQTIQTAVNEAVEEYQSAQREIGKDIVPDDLIELVKAAGAKRLNISDSTFAPVYTVVAANKVAALSGEATVTYGGLEDG